MGWQGTILVLLGLLGFAGLLVWLLPNQAGTISDIASDVADSFDTDC